MTPLRIGTRGSRLALWQAHFVAEQLRPIAAPRPVELVIISTTGDQVQDVPLSVIGGQGVFTKAIQQALVEERVDVAVHSLKDLPTVPVVGLVLAAVPSRGPTGDVFVSTRHARFDDLPAGATVATSSSRRRAQLLNHRPDLVVTEIRGNVETRLRKLDEQGLDGLLLAEAGLERLGLADRITEVLNADWMLPAVGQGALGIECRESDAEVRKLLRAALDDYETHQRVLAERSMLAALGGGCQLPIAAATAVRGNCLQLRGAVMSPDGKRRIVASAEASLDAPLGLGASLAADLLAEGARELLSG